MAAPTLLAPATKPSQERLLRLSLVAPVGANGMPGLATILLVDDDPNVLCPLQLLLEQEGYRVLTALDGEAALAAAAIESPNLIVTDWMMPRTDGVGLCRQLKDDTAMADIPVVMVSAALPPHPTARLWDVLLPKPTPIARLIKVIRTLLEGRGSNASAHLLKR
jgi:DNA-binding response OmpR family regulator